MSVTKDEVLALRETRVRIDYGGGDVFALLRALTPKDVVILAGHGGVETLVPLADVKEVEDARFECRKCGERVNRVFGETEEIAGSCSNCYREWAVRQPVPHELCDEPGCEVRAFYSPGAKKFRCAQHHAKYKTLSGIGAEARVLGMHSLADCRSDDIHSLRHDWKKVKSQWVCRNCRVKHFGEKPAGAEF